MYRPALFIGCLGEYVADSRSVTSYSSTWSDEKYSRADVIGLPVPNTQAVDDAVSEQDNDDQASHSGSIPNVPGALTVDESLSGIVQHRANGQPRVANTEFERRLRHLERAVNPAQDDGTSSLSKVRSGPVRATSSGTFDRPGITRIPDS
jgi:hypothetical protein